MLRTILLFGLAAGLIAGVPLDVMALFKACRPDSVTGMAIGYTTMLIALSTVFLAIKRRRDIDGGGAIRFWPALVLGLGISVVSGVIYTAAWDIASSLAHLDFANKYADAMVAAARSKGASGPALQKAIAEADAFRVNYANPFYRWPMTFIEIFPVGVLVSVVSAALLRNSRFLPARPAAA